MPRPKEFDPDVALDRAVDVFWSRGYGGTSIQHLVDALGVNRGSLYATFGDKHGLYLAALDRYRQSEVVQIVDLLEQPGPVKRVLRRPFDAVVLSVAEGRGGRGCLVCNAAVEQAADDADVEAAVWASLGRIERAFTSVLQHAHERGQLRTGAGPAALAHYFTSSFMGLRVVAKAGDSPAQLRDIVDLTLAILD